MRFEDKTRTYVLLCSDVQVHNPSMVDLIGAEVVHMSYEQFYQQELEKNTILALGKPSETSEIDADYLARALASGIDVVILPEPGHTRGVCNYIGVDVATNYGSRTLRFFGDKRYKDDWQWDTFRYLLKTPRKYKDSQRLVYMALQSAILDGGIITTKKLHLEYVGQSTKIKNFVMISCVNKDYTIETRTLDWDCSYRKRMEQIIDYTAKGYLVTGALRERIIGVEKDKIARKGK